MKDKKSIRGIDFPTNDERVTSFLERPLEGDWPYLWLDATYLKVRQGGRTVSVAAIIAVAANTDGRREIIGLSIGDSEAMVFWMEFLRSLVKRGLKGVKLVVSDAHEGLKAAGGPEDVNALRAQYTNDDIKDALDHAPAGVYDPRSWAYWNLLIGRFETPPMPERRFP